MSRLFIFQSDQDLYASVFHPSTKCVNQEKEEEEREEVRMEGERGWDCGQRRTVWGRERRVRETEER